MKKNFFLIGLAALLVAFNQTLSGQSLKIISPFELIPYASVMVQYQNRFGKWNMPDKADDRFPFALVRVQLEGSGIEVKAAKEMLQLNLGTQYVVQDMEGSVPNEIQFLIPKEATNIYITCGDGCKKQLLTSSGPFLADAVYICKVHYTMEEKQSDAAGFVIWTFQPDEVRSKATIRITSPSGKEVYNDSVHKIDLTLTRFTFGSTYSYTVHCPLYADVTDTFSLSGATDKEYRSVELRPYYNYVRVQSPISTPIRFTIDDDPVLYTSAMSQAAGPLEAGDHTLHCAQQMYENQDVKIHLSGDCSTQTFAPQMVRSVGKILIQSTPSNGDVYINNQLQGHTPFWSDAFPTGTHHIKVVHEGYLSMEKDVVVERGMQTGESFVLTAQASTSIQTKSVSAKLYITPEGQTNYTYLGEGTWSGELGVGTYVVKACAPDHDDVCTTIRVTDNNSRFTVQDPIRQTGYLSVKVHPTSADVYVDGKIVTSNPIRLNTGTHTVYASKNGYSTSNTKTLTVVDKTTTYAEFKLSNQWLHGTSWHPEHYFELTYGLGFQKNFNHYVGASYGYLPKRFGLNVSGLYGIHTGEIVLTAGPSMRLTDFSSALSLQLLLGGGGVYNMDAKPGNRLSWAADAGLRFAFEPGESLAWYSIGLGVKYFNQQFVPNLSVSLMPVHWLVLLALADSDLPSHRFETVAGYSFSSDKWKIGFNYSWTQSALGLYMQALFGFDDNYSVTVGPTFRLTPNARSFDLQLYQGIGWFLDRKNMFGGETGLRMGFGTSTFGWWSLNTSFEYAQNGYYGITFGVSIGILGTVGLVGGAVAASVWALAN